MQKRKLNGAALPLKALNEASAHEKSVPRKGHPATLYLWRARSPLAVLFAQLVGNPPLIRDPISGHGTIPLETQRRGLVAHASDPHSVAALVNKALIEIPPKFRDNPPIFSGLADNEIRGWNAAGGLAVDLRSCGSWMQGECDFDEVSES